MNTKRISPENVINQNIRIFTLMVYILLSVYSHPYLPPPSHWIHHIYSRSIGKGTLAGTPLAPSGHSSFSCQAISFFTGKQHTYVRT